MWMAVNCNFVVVSESKIGETFEFSLNVFTENLPPSHLLCKRPGYYRRISKTHVRDMIFKLSPIHASVIYQIL